MKRSHTPIMRSKRSALSKATVLAFALFLTACGAPKEEVHLMDAEIVEAAPETVASEIEVPNNICNFLSVPTQVMKVKDTWFIVDCYHNQVIYHDNMTDPLTDWKVLTSDLNMGHTIASDGTVYLIDDTENHRVLVFEKEGDVFVNTQILNNIGQRPHYIIYHEEDRTFYAWSSMTGEMYLIRRDETSGQMYVAEIRKIESLDGVYVRSFTIDGDKIYFVSGNSSILEARLKDFKIRNEYPVPSALAGMIQIYPVEDQFLITISTDSLGDQSYATIIQTDDLSGLLEGKYTDVYSNFVGGGTPYYISEIDGSYYLTEHRVPGHSVWKFDFANGSICNVEAIY